jgi:RimJ/RimL family protein N-acetyltransferase
LEIGFTWLAPQYQKTGLNRACKFLLIDFAFNQMGMQRVEFKTDAINRKSRNALKGIGATQEGILRSHTLMHDGRRRNTVFFGILKRDWPTEPYRLK